MAIQTMAAMMWSRRHLQHDLECPEQLAKTYHQGQLVKNLLASTTAANGKLVVDEQSEYTTHTRALRPLPLGHEEQGACGLAGEHAPDG